MTAPSLPLPPDGYRAAWLTTFGLARRYFRFECEGLEHLSAVPSALLVAYHGMPLPLDVFMLSVEIHERWGYHLPAVWARAWGKIPPLRAMVEALNGTFGPPTDVQIDAFKQARQHLVVCPGGLREALRPVWEAGRIDWGHRMGYVRLALCHDLPIIPIASSGADRAWWGLIHGNRWSKRLFGHGDAPIWLALGLGGPWPLSMPWPVRIRQKIGPPIDLEPFRRSATDEDALYRRIDAEVRREVQGLLDDLHRGR